MCVRMLLCDCEWHILLNNLDYGTRYGFNLSMCERERVSVWKEGKDKCICVCVYTHFPSSLPSLLLCCCCWRRRRCYAQNYTQIEWRCVNRAHEWLKYVSFFKALALSLYPSLSRCIYLPCDTLLVNGRKCATKFVSFQCLCVHTAVLSLLFNIGRSLLSFSLSMYVCVSCVVLREYENGRTLNAWVCVCVCMRAVFFSHLVLSSSKRQPFVCSLLYRWVYVCMYGCVSVLCA